MHKADGCAPRKLYPLGIVRRRLPPHELIPVKAGLYKLFIKPVFRYALNSIVNYARKLVKPFLLNVAEHYHGYGVLYAAVKIRLHAAAKPRLNYGALYRGRLGIEQGVGEYVHGYKLLGVALFHRPAPCVIGFAVRVVARVYGVSLYYLLCFIKLCCGLNMLCFAHCEFIKVFRGKLKRLIKLHIAVKHHKGV